VQLKEVREVGHQLETLPREDQPKFFRRETKIGAKIDEIRTPILAKELKRRRSLTDAPHQDPLDVRDRDLFQTLPFDLDAVLEQPKRRRPGAGDLVDPAFAAEELELCPLFAREDAVALRDVEDLRPVAAPCRSTSIRILEAPLEDMNVRHTEAAGVSRNRCPHMIVEVAIPLQLHRAHVRAKRWIAFQSHF
jgi:hypothetical protein